MGGRYWWVDNTDYEQTKTFSDVLWNILEARQIELDVE